MVPVPLHMRLSFANGLFWTSVACCAVAQFFILRSVRGRDHVRPEPTTPLPRQRDGMELLWAVVPAVALAVLLLFTWRAVYGAAAGTHTAPVIEAAR
jgi:heme/copper-type cytochrome/quinol oxidase subunit 2